MNFYKAFDHYKKLYREGGASRIRIAEIGDFYWLIDGYSSHRVPKKVMELNPEIFKPFAGDIVDLVDKADAGVDLKYTGLVKRYLTTELLPFTSTDDDPFTIWFNKKLLNTFPKEISLVASGPLTATAVRCFGETIGLVLPVRVQDDIKLFV